MNVPIMLILSRHFVCLAALSLTLAQCASVSLFHHKNNRWRKAIAVWHEAWWNSNFAVFADWESPILWDAVNFTDVAGHWWRVTVLRVGEKDESMAGCPRKQDCAIFWTTDEGLGYFQIVLMLSDLSTQLIGLYKCLEVLKKDVYGISQMICRSRTGAWIGF